MGKKRVRIKTGKTGKIARPDLAHHHAVSRWERQFRFDAEADHLALFRDHLCRLDLNGEPETMLDATVYMVRACAAYAKIDGDSATRFLSMQRYDPANSLKAEYAFTFDLGSGIFSRLLVPSRKVGQPDLADLYEHPWNAYRTCGYSSIWITRTDWAAFAEREVAKLQQEVTEDIRFDYSEDEVDFWFWYHTEDDISNLTYWLDHSESGTAGALLVNINDHDPSLEFRGHHT